MAKYIQKSKKEKKKKHATMYGSAQTLPFVSVVSVRVRDVVFDAVACPGAAVEVAAVVESAPVTAGGGGDDAAATIPEGHDDDSPLAWFVVVCGDGMFNSMLISMRE